MMYLLQQNNSSLYYQIQYINIDITESDVTLISTEIKKCKVLKRKQINTDKHEIMIRRERECASMTGTPEYESNKEMMRKVSQDRRTETAGTPEHEKAIRKKRQGLCAKIASLYEHEKQCDFTKNIKMFIE